MFEQRDQIRYFRSRIPSFACVEGCHDCCGPVLTSSEEISRLPSKTKAERAAALAEYLCPHLGAKGCTVYAERPIICRLFGTTPRLPCPHGRAPEVMIDPRIDAQIQKFFIEVRQVLV
ncbi:YkgJ family cysteine cluster protein [Chitinibacter bivalviorum]|uniref:YkgJ family cysteine cluster protein n=1 Tax=Chitinibacter bivalviorum TaxID=2739434 RepID=A0A7H9BKA3_9NEIS|nr:YkgJ family cysteine cluster protein [Chitinibacter bivalviorum]QLG88919.1 YkgJ family cysteine cluster protein [Chitinibacter bivalviorum]